MVIIALDHVPHCFSQSDGILLHDAIKPFFDRGEKFTLSFTGVEDVTSSFVNSSLVPFVEKCGSKYVKDHLRVVGATKQVSNTILRCFSNVEIPLVA